MVGVCKQMILSVTNISLMIWNDQEEFCLL